MTMPAGRYYIGDLCYVMHPEWDEVCDLMFVPDDRGFPKEVEGEMVLKDGRRFATFSTYWGDGEYVSNIDTSHGVDSGSIGCIRVEDIRDTTYGNIEDLGAVVEFDTEFEVSKHGGLLKFGNVEIETKADTEEWLED